MVIAKKNHAKRCGQRAFASLNDYFLPQIAEWQTNLAVDHKGLALQFNNPSPGSIARRGGGHDLHLQEGDRRVGALRVLPLGLAAGPAPC